jgi:NADH:ubiquinone oxidoreductase subunit F (NADH-binding)
MTTVTGLPNRLLAATTPDLVAHHARHGPLPRLGQGRLIQVVQDAGLTGRGGAGFPTWRKLAAVAAGSRPVVIANAAEGEPASAKDRVLLARAPHLVLDGLQLAAEAVGADRSYIYAASDAVRRAVAERRRGPVRVEVVSAPNRFVSGEESAVVAAVEGRRAVPRDTPRRVVEAGVHGRPTLVQNVETLAHLALIARHGAGWFRSLGTSDEPGTLLTTVSGAVTCPGVHEIPHGLPLASLLALAGGPTEPVQAILVGGYHGAWLPASLVDTPMSRAGLRPVGASPGAGIVVVLPASRCGLVDSAKIAGYLAEQGAGQCGPCVNGLPRLADTLARLARGEHVADEVERLSRLVDGRGACHHPDGTVRFVRSSLRVFADEVARHRAGRCSVGGLR